MFKYLIIINPLGFMYGSAGAFLSPENLVGRSGAKFPPEASTVSGLLFSVNKNQQFFSQEELSHDLWVAGPFWATCDDPEYFYVPIPWHKIIATNEADEWRIEEGKWQRDRKDLEPDYRWQIINSWDESADVIRRNGDAAKSPWEFVPVLHPRTKDDERCVQEKDGLFLEYSVQMVTHKQDNMHKDTCLVYLSTHSLPEGWYRFGGENHVVEISSLELPDDSPILKLLHQPIQSSFALITPGIWGSTRFSYRYPQKENFPNQNVQMLTDKPVPYRYRAKGQLGRGRYAVPAGSVYVLEQPIGKPWWEWDEDWFPKEGFSLKRVGCGLCLPIDIQGVE